MSESKLPQKVNAAELALVSGDLSKLTAEERISYYNRVCESLGLNPLTKPFDYVNLKGKLTFYATKNCAEQLRQIHKISIYKIEKEILESLLTVTAYARDASGKEDSDLGAVDITGLKGEALANATMKAITKAKRRVTLSIAGLGMLDESEVASSRYASSVKTVRNAEIAQQLEQTTARPEYEEILTAEIIPFEPKKGLAHYVFKTGTSRKGKAMLSFEDDFLINALDWYDGELQNGKNFDPNTVEDFENIRKYLESK